MGMETVWTGGEGGGGVHDHHKFKRGVQSY